MYDSIRIIIGVKHKIGMEKRLAVMRGMRSVPTVVLSTYKQSGEGRKVDATKINIPGK
jgi:hypothetical protein